MDWLTSLYPEVRQVLEDGIPDCWPELRPIFDTIFAKPPPLLSVAILPLVSCHAVNGTAREAVPVSAALIATEVSLRIFDDLEDKDRPGQLWELLGEARAWNYASAIHILSFEILSKASFSPQIFRKVNQLFIDAFFYITVGQERDLIGLSNSIEDYWRTIELKTATAYSAACASGAMLGTENQQLIEACHVFGHHVGLAIQIFNDMESIWQPDGITDLKQGKITLPLLYGLQAQHPERDELLSLVTDNDIAIHAERIKEILDQIDTKSFLIWAALKEREQALEAIKVCPNAEGREVLESYITGMFGDIDLLLEKPEGDKT
ncbi:MAG: polyprenyl synthetase family protein [Coleofasciculus sp. B1-GNL1-01]|uniref:polyprenyl synthetase family protein n=1 Tax=Coleofasciculus sp. B1-GNL1-01 TaxID=3068484 RepID=UPI00330348B3